MKAMQHTKTHDEAETLHLKLHPIPSVAYYYALDAVPNLGDNQCKTMHQLITETKSSSSIKIQKCATVDYSSLKNDMLSDCTSAVASMTNSYDYGGNFYDDDSLDFDENALTSWSTENLENYTNDTQTDLLLNVIKESDIQDDSNE